ncbi:hypothetical protein DAEQUDRAFT_105980 [Daedalea quercina L-15889]|uniref:Uncharacterized protein n=1 Tax=Daedalea quercina L-15889 TaxID=1314783 RepID=A0A165S2A0_9APHY|nr:hypothetical protein DAEQUDRAFT_105980 [Daedalea quercina L-15889]
MYMQMRSHVPLAVDRELDTSAAVARIRMTSREGCICHVPESKSPSILRYLAGDLRPNVMRVLLHLCP